MPSCTVILLTSATSSVDPSSCRHTKISCAVPQAQAKEAAKAAGEELSDDEGDGDGFGVEGAVRRAEASSTVTGPELQVQISD